MRTNKMLMIAAGILVLVAYGPSLHASEEIGEAEDLVCTSCHDKPGSKLLTGKGKYYEVMRTIDGYEEVTRVFGPCTNCHRRKPGSKKLTSVGRRFGEIVGGMEGLKELLLMEHPKPPPVEENDAAPAVEETDLASDTTPVATENSPMEEKEND